MELPKGSYSLTSKLILSSILSRTGILQVGDRVLALNGQILEGMALEEARSIIKNSNCQLHLEVEFDVAGKNMRNS